MWDEIILYLPLTVQQCIREAELAHGEQSEIIQWWDRLADAARIDAHSNLTAIGREEEKCSVGYEQSRTGTRPHWTALYSSNAGYDLLSRVNETDSAALRVEVKANKQKLDVANVYLTIGEWDTALGTESYVFHLWLLGLWDKPQIVKPEEMKKHVPNNSGKGGWQLAVVPFSALA